MSKINRNLSLIVLLIAIAYNTYRVGSVFYKEFQAAWGTSLLIFAFLLAIISKILSIKTNYNNELHTIAPSKLLSLSLIASLTFSILLQAVFLDISYDWLGRSSHEFTRNILVLGVIWLFLGSVIQRAKLEQSYTSTVVILLFLTLTIYGNLQESLVISYTSLSDQRSDGIELDHLVAGESAAFLIIFAYATSPNKIKPFTAIISIGILFSLGGRTSLITYLASIFIFSCMRVKFKLFILSIPLILLIYIFINSDLISINSQDAAISRMLLIDGIEADESAITRKNIFLEGLNALPSQALMGDPTFLIKRLGSLGLYIHNILSAWQLFGLIPFLLFLYSIFYSLYYIKSNIKSINNPIDDFGVILLLYASISIFTGKYIGFFSIWLSIGFWLSRMEKTTNQTKTHTTLTGR